MSLDFSIIIPCFNQAHFLPDCLDSILKQDVSSWEAIIVNDGSQDSTSQVSQNYCDRDLRFRLISQPNQGLSAARNAGLRQACGKRVIFLDADDYLYSDCLSVISMAPGFDDDRVVIQYGYTYVTEDNKSRLQTVMPQPANHWFPDIFTRVPGPCHTICASLAQLRLCGEFDESLRSLEDWDMWLRLFKTGIHVSPINRPLVFYRYVKNSMSRNAEVMYRSFSEVAGRATRKDQRILVDSAANHPYDFDMLPVMERALFRMTAIMVMQGKTEDAIAFFRERLKTDIHSLRPELFEEMCSYLSFRYWYQEDEIEFVLNELKPLFRSFLTGLGYGNTFTRAALHHIFKRHQYHYNNKRAGRILGGIINRYQDFIYARG